MYRPTWLFDQNLTSLKMFYVVNFMLPADTFFIVPKSSSMW